MRLESHHLRQHLRARDDWNRTMPSFNNLWIVLAHGGRANDHVSVANVFSPVPFFEINAQELQPLRHFGAFQVRAGNVKAGVNQNLCDTGHAYAADAYEMNLLNTTKHKSVVSGQWSVVSCFTLDELRALLITLPLIKPITTDY